MVRLVYENAVGTELFDDVVVATDDEKIRDVITEAGGRAMMTSADHPSGTDRVAEVARTIGAEIIVNIQGDLPFVNHALLAPLVGAIVSEMSVSMATLAVPIRDRDVLMNPNVVKVVTDLNGFALYFSRAPIPARRVLRQAQDERAENDAEDGVLGLQHVGIYAYRRDFLFRFTSWAPTRLEQLERLEQLRALEHGVKIHVAQVSGAVLEVDTEEDLLRANEVGEDIV